MSNSLDQDQHRHLVGADLGPSCLHRLSTNNKICHYQGKSLRGKVVQVKDYTASMYTASMIVFLPTISTGLGCTESVLGSTVTVTLSGAFISGSGSLLRMVGDSDFTPIVTSVLGGVSGNFLFGVE